MKATKTPDGRAGDASTQVQILADAFLDFATTIAAGMALMHRAGLDLRSPVAVVITRDIALLAARSWLSLGRGTVGREYDVAIDLVRCAEPIAARMLGN